MKVRSNSVQRLLSALLCFAMMVCIALPVFAEEVQCTGYYVGEVEITFQNAGDVLGDGKVSYDIATKTLTLKNVDITGNDVDGSYIYADGNLTIVLEGENRITVLSDVEQSTAVCVYGDLIIKGSGTLTVTAADVVQTASTDVDYAESTVIYAEGDVTISEATVTAKAGAATIEAAPGWAGNTVAYSEAVMADGNLSVQDGAKLVAIGGTAIAEKMDGSQNGKNVAYSVGVYCRGKLSVEETGLLEVTGTMASGTSAYSYGVQSQNEEGTCLEINGTMKALGGEAAAQTTAFSLGVYAIGDICVNETGVLETSGRNANATKAYSKGIESVDGSIYIHGGTVKTVGATADGIVNGVSDLNYPSHSVGVGMSGELCIDQGGSLTAIGGNAAGDTAYSSGIENSYGGISVYDGTLTATAVGVEGVSRGESFGVYMTHSSSGFYVYDEDAVVTLSCADTKGSEKAFSNALFVSGGDVGIEAGTVTAISGKKDAPLGDSYAICVESKTNNDGVTTGGNLWINSDSARFDLFGATGTKVEITSGGTGAVYASESLELGDDVAFKLPQGGKAVQQASGEWVIVDAKGETAMAVTLKTSLCKTLSQKVQNLFE